MSYKITGAGLLCGLGSSPREVFNNMCAGGTAFRPIQHFDAASYAQKMAGALSPEDEAALAAAYPEEDRAIALALHAGRQAIAGAVRQGPRALVLGTNFGPMETLQWSWQERLDTGTLDAYTYAPAADYVKRIAHQLDCDGPAQQLSMSCASGAATLALAWDLLESGRAQSVLVIAYDSLSEYAWCGLSNLHTITTDTMRPFDLHRSGTLFSEGAAAVLLEKADSPARPLAWLEGVATGNNATHLTAPRPEGEGSRQVMEAALSNAGLQADAIQHVCAHATSTRANDATEAAAIRRLFGSRAISVSAHKSQLGHLLGAAGLAEIIITIQAMAQSIIPPTVNHGEMDPECAPLDCIPASARVKDFSTAITNSAGIGGNNAATVLSRGIRPRGTQTPQSTYSASLANAGWVLPCGTGAGTDIPAWEEGPAALEALKPKEFGIKKVKGYLDPAGAAVLVASALALGTDADRELSPRRGVVSATRFGSQKSAYAFYEQMATKGPRLASPMLFPHGYANTPGNLAAMEFGCAGPHAVLYGPEATLDDAMAFAKARIADGSADEMLVIVYEATYAPALPDGAPQKEGAVAYLLRRNA